MSKTENKRILEDVAVKNPLTKQIALDKEINSILEDSSNERKIQSYLSTEKIYTGPNMRGERDNFRSKAQSFRLNKHF